MLALMLSFAFRFLFSFFIFFRLFSFVPFGGWPSWRAERRHIAIANFSTQSLHVVWISCILRLLKRIKTKEKMAFETAETILFILPQWQWQWQRRRRRIHFIKTGEVFFFFSFRFVGSRWKIWTRTNAKWGECICKRERRMGKTNELLKIRCTNEWKCTDAQTDADRMERARTML